MPSDPLNPPSSGWIGNAKRARAVRWGILFQEHHVIPKELFTIGASGYDGRSDLFKKLSISSQGQQQAFLDIFSPASRLQNGMVLDVAKHSGSHGAYTNGIKLAIDELYNDPDYTDLRNGTLTETQAIAKWGMPGYYRSVGTCPACGRFQHRYPGTDLSPEAPQQPWHH